MTNCAAYAEDDAYCSAQISNAECSTGIRQGDINNIDAGLTSDKIIRSIKVMSYILYAC